MCGLTPKPNRLPAPNPGVLPSTAVVDIRGLSSRDLIALLDAERLATHLGTADPEELDRAQAEVTAELDRRFPLAARRSSEVIARLLAMAVGARVFERAGLTA